MTNPAASMMTTNVLSQTARVQGKKIQEICMLLRRHWPVLAERPIQP
nr:hypothetical protein [Methylobacterium sp. ZNC0032]